MLACLPACLPANLFVCWFSTTASKSIIFPYAVSVGFVKTLDKICSVFRGTLFKHKNLLGISKSRHHPHKKN
jgi:hypothetical protein